MNSEIKESLNEAIRLRREYNFKPVLPQCSTHQVSTGEHCPEQPKHDIEGELLCDKCYNTALRIKLLWNKSKYRVHVKEAQACT